MKLPYRWHPKELILLCGPIVLLIICGIMFRDRGPFKLVIKEAELTLPSKSSFGSIPPEPHTRAVKVKVFIEHEGNTPSWWGDGLNVDGRVNFTAKNEKDTGSNVGAYDYCHYDESSGRYFFNYEGEIPENPQFLEGATCHMAAELRSQTPPDRKLAGTATSISARNLSRR